MHRLARNDHTALKATQAHLLLCIRRLLIRIVESMVRAEQVRLPVVLVQSSRNVANYSGRVRLLRLSRRMQLLGLTPLQLLITNLAVRRVVSQTGRLLQRVRGRSLHHPCDADGTQSMH